MCFRQICRAISPPLPWACAAWLPLPVLAQEQPAAPAVEQIPIPRFRSIDADAPHAERLPLPTLRLLAEPDYAPWSFTLDDGTLAGISVDLARAACTEAGPDL